MYLSDMINTIYAVLRKEERGGVFTVDDFNRYVSLFAKRVYDEKKSLMEATSDITEDMERYVVTTTVTTTSPGTEEYMTETMPADFEKHLSAVAMYNGYYNRKIDLVTRLEFQDRVGDELTKPTAKNPIMYYEDGLITIYPNVQARITYLKSPSDPFLDYYYDSDRNIQYMDEDESVALESGEEYRDGTTGETVVSLTEEMDMDEGMQLDVMNRILRLLGASIPNEGIFHYGSQEEAKA